jgi:phosphomannomutase/phosphoglucomutase
MSDHKTRLSLAQLRPAMPALAVVCALLALWLGWSGWRQWQDANRSQTLQQSRDLAAQGTGRALQQQTQQMRDKLASPPVQAALAAGNLAEAAAGIQRGWPHAGQAQVLPADLQAAYAALPQAGFGRLAAAEAALAADAPIARIAKDGEPALLIAAPAKVGARLVGVAVIHLPL